jgi:hypothetical protein
MSFELFQDFSQQYITSFINGIKYYIIRGLLFMHYSLNENDALPKLPFVRNRSIICDVFRVFLKQKLFQTFLFA